MDSRSCFLHPKLVVKSGSPNTSCKVERTAHSNNKVNSELPDISTMPQYLRKDRKHEHQLRATYSGAVATELVQIPPNTHQQPPDKTTNTHTQEKCKVQTLQELKVPPCVNQLLGHDKPYIETWRKVQNKPQFMQVQDICLHSKHDQLPQPCFTFGFSNYSVTEIDQWTEQTQRRTNPRRREMNLLSDQQTIFQPFDHWIQYSEWIGADRRAQMAVSETF